MSEEIVDLLAEPPDPVKQLLAMDFCVTRINEVIDGTTTYAEGGLKDFVGNNVGHLELMMDERVDELGESPDLSSYETAVTAGKTYMESA